MEHLPEGTHALGFHEELIPLMKGSRGKRDPNWSCERYIQTFQSVGSHRSRCKSSGGSMISSITKKVVSSKAEGQRRYQSGGARDGP